LGAGSEVRVSLNSDIGVRVPLNFFEDRWRQSEGGAAKKYKTLHPHPDIAREALP
jgi:hypothetical protein